MALVFTDAQVTINGTTDDISDYVKSVSVELGRSEHDDTTMGASGKTRQTGLQDNSVSLDFVDSFASGELDSLMWTVFSNGANVEMRVRITSGSITATNPEYRFTICPTASGVGGEVDSLAAKSISWPISGAVTRHTS